jgi:hypothetical protein
MKEMELFQSRNGIIEGKWLLVENRAIWSNILSCVTQGENRFRNDLVFFLMRQKCEWVGHTIQSPLQQETNRGGTPCHGVGERK